MNKTPKSKEERKFAIGSRIEDAQVGGGGGTVTKCGVQQVWFRRDGEDHHGHISNFRDVCDRKDNRTDEQKAIGAYYDRAMPRGDNGSLDYLSDERAFDGEDAEAWQEQSERQGVE